MSSEQTDSEREVKFKTTSSHKKMIKKFYNNKMYLIFISLEKTFDSEETTYMKQSEQRMDE